MKLLMLGCPSSQKELFQKAAKELGIELSVKNYFDLNFFSQDKTLRVGGTDLKAFDAVYLRLVGEHREELNLIADYCRLKKIALFDKVLLTGSVDRKKSFDALKLTRIGLPYPRTFFGSLKTLRQKAVGLGFPLIIKDTAGRKGRDVFLAKDNKELVSLIKKLKEQEEAGKHFLLQEFIPNDGDYRLIVIGQKVIGTIKRVPGKGEFRSNISLGGEAVLVGSLGRRIEKIAVKAALSLRVDFAGVDIILDQRNDQPFILEVNRSPQFAGFMAATKINAPLLVLKYLKEEILRSR